MNDDQPSVKISEATHVKTILCENDPTHAERRKANDPNAFAFE